VAQGQLAWLLRNVRQLIGRQGDEALADSGLLERYVRARDEAAFAALVERHGPMVFGVARRLLRNADDAEDVFQATFLVLARHAGSVRGPSVGGWLHRVAWRLAAAAHAETVRREQSHREVPPMATNDPRRTTDLAEWRPVLDEEVQRLPEKYRVPVVLCYLEGLTNDEAARQLGWPRGTVMGRLARARELLRRRLARRGLTLAAGAPLMAGSATVAVPPGLAAAAVRAAARLASEEPLAAAVSLRATTWADQLEKAMLLSKLKFGAALVFIAGVVGLGTGASLLLPADRVGPAALSRNDETGAERARNDIYGDPLPPGAVTRLGSVRLRHASLINGMSVSSDGKLLASVGHDNRIVLWETATGKEVRRIQQELIGTPAAVAFSPDGMMLAAGGGGMGTTEPLRLWETATGKEIRRFNHDPKFHLRAVAFSPDGRVLGAAGLGGRGVIAWTVATGKELWQSNDKSSSYSIAFSPDGKSLITGSTKGGIGFWEVATGKRRHQLVMEGTAFGRVAPSPNGKVLAALSSRWADAPSVSLWDAVTLKKLPQFQELRGDSFAFSPDSRTLAVQTSGETCLYDLATGKKARAFPAEGGKALTFTADGKFLASLLEHEICYREAATGKNVHRFTGHHARVSSLLFSADGRALTSAAGGLSAQSFTPDRRLWAPATGREIRRLPSAPANAYSCIVSADGKTFAYNAQGKKDFVHVCDAATGKEVRKFRLKSTNNGVQLLALSPDAQLLAWEQQDGKHLVRVSDATTAEEVRSIPNPLGWVAFSPDGKTVATNNRKKQVCLWDLATGKEREFGTPSGGGIPRYAIWAADGKTLASWDVDGQTICLWDVATGKERKLGAHPGRGSALTFSPDGKCLGSGARDGTVRVWDIATGKERHRFGGHQGSVTALAFSPDSQTLASGGDDTTVLVWDLTSRARNAAR
jgi:RNA polymerase sigma factor (sigma-70 family)